jgi:uncharacterized protein (TIGR02646 family)
MEKITKTPLPDLPSLSVLADNYVQWGEEFKRRLDSGGKSSDFAWKNGTYTIRRREALRTHLNSGGEDSDFGWEANLYNEMRHQLSLITKGHCSFCDDHPIGTNSTETIEHYCPKVDYPLDSYDWVNLFYCCTKCQSEANRNTFQETLRPDIDTYCFSDYFYFDLDSGQLRVLENLETDNPIMFEKANAFLIRYGISNNTKKNNARKHLFKVLFNLLPTEDFQRDDFEYRYVYDFCLEFKRLA